MISSPTRVHPALRSALWGCVALTCKSNSQTTSDWLRKELHAVMCLTVYGFLNTVFTLQAYKYGT